MTGGFVGSCHFILANLTYEHTVSYQMHCYVSLNIPVSKITKSATLQTGIANCEFITEKLNETIEIERRELNK